MEKDMEYKLITVALTCTLINIVLDVLKPLSHKKNIEKELEGFEIWLNQVPTSIVILKKERGIIAMNSMVPLIHLDIYTVKAILSEYRIHYADVCFI